MDFTKPHQQNEEEDVVMEVPEIDGDLLLAELLDASLAGAGKTDDDEATAQQLDFTVDDVDGVWVDDSGHEPNSIHAHHDCEDCGLDGSILSDFDLDGCGCSRSPPPYAAFDFDDETAEAALGPFVGECVGEWYMDGMAMEWEEEDDDEGNDLVFRPYYYDGGGEVETNQAYGTPLWE